MRNIAFSFLGLFMLSACHMALLAPKPKVSKATYSIKLFGDPWQCGFSIIDNAMPGATGKPYGVLSLSRESTDRTFAFIKAERVWFYQGDSLISSLNDFEEGFQFLNQDHLTFVIRDVPAFRIPNLHAVVRLRNSWGRSYLLRFPMLNVNTVY